MRKDGQIIMTAHDVYNTLLNEDKILTIKGQITFHLGDVGIIVKKKDIVGNVVQEWTEGWLRQRGVDFLPNPQTQMPPDIFLNTQDLTKDWMEVKAFNREASPGFDIADFKAFVPELIAKPYHLDTDYLIFGYAMDEETGDVTIKDLWIKKIWEIMRPMADWPITLQYKNGIVQKMRPGIWYNSGRTSRRTYPNFSSMEDFLSAFEETVFQNPETRSKSALWKKQFQRSYKNHYGVDIDFPRWNDIKHNYYG